MALARSIGFAALQASWRFKLEIGDDGNVLESTHVDFDERRKTLCRQPPPRADGRAARRPFP
jgi:hypothetical protein